MTEFDTATLDARHVWHPFTQAATAPAPIPIKSAKGVVLTAEDGKEYLDLVSSWWVNLHGHAHPVVAEAIAEQARTLEQVIFAGFTHQPAARVAKNLSDALPGDLNRVFYSDDGSTAVEVALKLAHQYWRNMGEIRPRFIAFEGGYHGDTFGAMSVGASSGFFGAWDDLMFEVDAIPYPATWDGDPDVEAKEAASLAALDALLEKHPGRFSALIVEPLIQGASGMNMCRPEFLRALEARLHAAGVLQIYDEVMTGFGRTGALFACLKAETTPDLISLSKGLTAGFLAMSVTVCRDRLYDAFLDESFDKAFTHGHSFTANPLGCAAAIASWELLTSPETLERLASIEALHRDRIARVAERTGFARPRVTGTVAAIDVESASGGYTAEEGPRLKAYFHERGLLLRPLGNVIYVLPPYCVTDDQLHRAWDAIEASVEQAL